MSEILELTRMFRSFMVKLFNQINIPIFGDATIIGKVNGIGVAIKKVPWLCQRSSIKRFLPDR